MKDSVRIFLSSSLTEPFGINGVSSDMNNKDRPPQPEILVEGVDYYIENGYWVFTSHYLQKRGYCCGSGCRHCPYSKKKDSSKQWQ